MEVKRAWSFLVDRNFDGLNTILHTQIKVPSLLFLFLFWLHIHFYFFLLFWFSSLKFFPLLFSYLFLVWSFLITLNINGDFCWDLLCFLLLSNGVAIGSSTSTYLLLALLSCPRTVQMVHAITSAIASLLARNSWSVELEHYEALQLRIYRYSYEL